MTISRTKASAEASIKQELEERFAMGDRVCMSPLGAERHPRYAEQRGTVVGLSRYPSVVRIQLDRSRTPVALHKDYLMLVEASSRRS